MIGLERVDTALNVFSSNSFAIDDAEVEKAFMLRDRIAVIMSEYRAPDRHVNYTGQLLDLDGNTVGEKVDILKTIAYSKGNLGFSISPDSSKICVFNGSPSSKRSDARLQLTTLSSDLKITDTATFDLSKKEIDGVKYHCYDAAIANSGLVYVMMYKTINNSSEQAFFVLVYDPAQRTLQEINLSKNDLIEVTMFVDEAGDLAITGYLGHSPDSKLFKKNVKYYSYEGVYVIKVSGSQRIVTHQKTTPLPENVEDVKYYGSDTHLKEYRPMRGKGGYVLVSRAVMTHGFLTFFNHGFATSITNDGDLKYAARFGVHYTEKLLANPDEHEIKAWYDGDMDVTYVLMKLSAKGLSNKEESNEFQSLLPGGDPSGLTPVIVTIAANGTMSYQALESLNTDVFWMPWYSIRSKNKIMVLGRKDNNWTYGIGTTR
jgi:hypothetical protein